MSTNTLFSIKSEEMNYLNIPGYAGSGPGHWQTIWERINPKHFKRVEQENWTKPELECWVDKLHLCISELYTPTVLIAHSLGCLALVHWAKKYSSPFVAGALLVAPADVSRTEKACVKTFNPVPIDRLPFPSILAASINDPYASMETTAKWAAYWGSRFVCVGKQGHVNSDSGLGIWPEGIDLLKSLSYKQHEGIDELINQAYYHNFSAR